MNKTSALLILSASIAILGSAGCAMEAAAPDGAGPEAEQATPTAITETPASQEDVGAAQQQQVIGGYGYGYPGVGYSYAYPYGGYGGYGLSTGYGVSTGYGASSGYSNSYSGGYGW